MKKAVLVVDKKIGEWVARHLPASEDIKSAADFGKYVSMGYVRDGKPIVGVVYNAYRELRHGNDIRVTIVATSRLWATKEIISTLISYPFQKAGCMRITAIIREGNDASVQLARRLGFRKEGVIRKAYNGKANALVFGMLKSECKWLTE